MRGALLGLVDLLPLDDPYRVDQLGLIDHGTVAATLDAILEESKRAR